MAFESITFSWLISPDWPVLAGAVVVALLLDVWLGEPRVSLHPVVWMGNYLGWAGQYVAPKMGELPRPLSEFLKGVLGWWSGAFGVLVLAGLCGWALLQLPWVGLQILLLGVLLKPMLAWRMLRDEVLAVEQALAESLDAGRQRLRWLVSRDVSALNATQVREAAISTLAENLNDSVVAPLFWFAVAGLPGAVLYRFANTADAMWGYPGERQGRHWAWAGKWTARVDDVLSWLPARLTAVLLCMPRLWRGLGVVLQSARLTPSPNSGWPMAALAVGLGIRLGKTGVYQLNPQGRAAVASDTALALRVCGQVVAGLAAVSALVVVASVLESV